MSIMWSLVNVLKGQQFSLMLCALCLIVQWSCHCSAEDPIPNISPSIAAANNTQSGVPSTIENKRNNSLAIATAAPGDANSSALSLAENSSSQLKLDDQFNVTKMTLQSTQITFHDRESTSTNVSSTTGSESLNGGIGAISEMQGDSKHSKTGQPVVLISLLTCGLTLAALILAAYYRMNKQSWSPQGKRLDEEPDAEDHDSIIFSVASEDQSDAHEKPKLNGEAQENGENQRSAAAAATGNGHQRKIIEEADTEL